MRQFSRDASGVEHRVDTYSYDPAGRMTKIHDAPRVSGNYGYSFDGKTFHFGPDAATITTLHDAAGRPTEMLFHDSSGALVSRVDFQYDDAGNVIEETQSHTVSPFAGAFSKLTPEHRESLQTALAGPMSRSRHRYNPLGQRIETQRSLFGLLSSELITMEYNQHGDLIAQTSRDESREFGLDEQGQFVERPGLRTYSETRFVYEYDSRGNWTSKITQGRSDDHSDFSPPHQSERRTIAYFENL